MVSLIAMGLMMLASSRVVRIGTTVFTGVKVWRWREGERNHRLGVNRTVKKRYKKERETRRWKRAKPEARTRLVENELQDTTFGSIMVNKRALPEELEFVSKELILTTIETERFIHETNRFLRGERRPDPLLAIEELVDFSNERKKDRRVMAQVAIIKLQN